MNRFEKKTAESSFSVHALQREWRESRIVEISKYGLTRASGLNPRATLPFICGYKAVAEEHGSFYFSTLCPSVSSSEASGELVLQMLLLPLVSGEKAGDRAGW